MEIEKSLTNPQIVYNKTIVQIHKIKARMDNDDSLNGRIFTQLPYIFLKHIRKDFFTNDEKIKTFSKTS